MSGLTIEAEDGETDFWGTSAGDMQSGLEVGDGAITGTLKYLSTGTLANDWGAGNFMALKFSGIDERATSVKVGMDPSQSSGLVEIINDPDLNGVFKVTNKDTQRFKVVVTDGHNRTVQTFDLSGLTLESA